MFNNKYNFLPYILNEDQSYYKILDKYPNLDFNPFILEYGYDGSSFDLSKVPINYIEYYKYDEFIFNGPGIVLKINGLIEKYYTGELFINKKIFTNYKNLSNYIGKYGININFYNRNNKLIEKFGISISPIIKIYETYDKFNNIIQVNMYGGNNIITCCCGYTANTPYQNLLLFAGNNISNLIYKTHDQTVKEKFRKKFIGYFSFIKGNNDDHRFFSNS